MGSIIVLGLGNILRGDEGVGVHALEALREGYRLPPNVVLVDGGTAGFRLLESIAGADRLLVLDAVDAGAKPGTLFQFTPDQLPPATVSASLHEAGLPDLLAWLEATESRRPETVIIGVQAGSISPWKLDLSGPVRAALPQLIELALDQLARWEVQAEPKISDSGNLAQQRRRYLR